jgi:hypothetical protein
MSRSAAVWPPHPGLIGATVLGTRDPLPPVYPPPGNHGRKLASPSPCGPRLPPGVRVLTPPPTTVDHKYPPDHLTNVLPNSLRLS